MFEDLNSGRAVSIRTYIWLENWKKTGHAAPLSGRTPTQFLADAVGHPIKEILMTVDRRDERLRDYLLKSVKEDEILQDLLKQYPGVKNCEIKNVRVKPAVEKFIKEWCRAHDLTLYKVINIMIHNEISKCDVIDIHAVWPHNWVNRYKEFNFTKEELDNVNKLADISKLAKEKMGDA